jgi:ASPIC and UnbV/Secretion system C-terminal sorting domain/Ig-like domain CHU_C associated
VRSGESYGISNSLTVQFGLGANTAIDSISVRWPSGKVDVVVSPTADQYITLQEGGCLVEAVNIAAAGPTTFCTGDSVRIDAPAGFTYLWSTGDTTASISATAAGRYQVTVTNVAGCTAVSNAIRVVLDPIEIPEVVVAGDTLLCAGSSVQLTAASGTAWTWSNGATTQSITVSATGIYTVAAQGQCAIFTSKPVNVKVLTPELPVTTGDVIWVGGRADLSATGDEPHWYDAVMGGNELFVGNDFQTPPLTQTTTFWAANNDIEDRPNENTGMVNHSGTNGSAQFNGGIVFDCELPFRLRTVKVYSSVAGARKIVVLDNNGVELTSKTVVIPVGSPTTVTLNMDIPAGQNLVLTTDEATNMANLNTIAPQLRRSDSGVVYPYTIPGVVNIKNSTAPTQPEIRYYYFYNWEVDFYGIACLSDRVAAVATVDPDLVGTKNLAEHELLSVSPNPATDAVWVKTSAFAGGHVAVKLLDVRGQILRQQSQKLPENGAFQIETAQLPAGIYLLEISNGEKFARGKFVKQ